jgi:glycerophosphoryl diester phosphodiesterase
MPATKPVVAEAIIAHRGAPRYAPENTLPGMEAAARLGARWVEVDVKLTADMQPVIIHDDTVDRTTNGRGLVAGLTLAEVRGLDAGIKFGAQFAATRVPTLAELIESVLDLDLGLQLELKPTPGDDIETAQVALDILKTLWPASRQRLFITSFSIRSLHAARAILPDVPRAFAVVVPPRDPVALMAETGCQILHCLSDLLTDEALKILADSGIEHAVAVINDAARARHFLAAGAQSVLTDIPDLLEPAAMAGTR